MILVFVVIVVVAMIYEIDLNNFYFCVVVCLLACQFVYCLLLCSNASAIFY